jgi:phosphoribosylanthranilate isomerase
VALEIIKVCGITRMEDALSAARDGATAIGLNFYPGSPRYVDFGLAAMIRAVVPAAVTKVGIFVDEDPERIRTTAQAVGLDVVQLHGTEAPFDCETLAPLRVWKAFRVETNFDPHVLTQYSCEAFVLDGAAAGRTFPWGIARAAAQYGRIIVAGGLDAGNVAEAIREAQPWGVDASSRLERSPGVKDPAKVREFIDEAKRHAGAT